MPRARRPWYGFLYYLLGAQGSFFAWLIAATGVYFTWREAALYVLNREPRDVTVAEVVAGAGKFQRWVRVSGVEVDLGSALFLPAAGAGAAPSAAGRGSDTVLVDPEDPAAVAWRDLFKAMDALETPRPGETEAQADQRQKVLWALVFDVGTEKTRARFQPARALVVVNVESEGARAARTTPASPTATAAPADGAGGDPGGLQAIAERWQRRTQERIELIRSAVRVGVVRSGLLEPSQLLEKRYAERYEVRVAKSALVVGHRPSELFAGIFGGFATVLFFLVVGLRALRKVDNAAPPQ